MRQPLLLELDDEKLGHRVAAEGTVAARDATSGGSSIWRVRRNADTRIPRSGTPMRHVSLLLLLLALALPSAAQGTFRDISSGSLGTSPFGHVAAAAEGPNGEIYVAGRLEMAGDTSRCAVAMWDGAAWRALGTGMDTPSPTDGGVIRALAVTPDGTLYAGGEFESAGGAAASGIARWDGAAWQPLGAGLRRGPFPGSVSALAVAPDGSLYVAGWFDAPNDAASSGIARWDGTAWQPLPTLRANLSAVAVTPDGTVYVGGGGIRLADGTTAQAVARLDGGAWRGLPARVHDSVLELILDADGAVVANGLYASGQYEQSRHVARWTGTAWASLGGWSAFGHENGAGIRTLTVRAAADGAIYAGGDLTLGNDAPRVNLARWDGSTWAPAEGDALGGAVSAVLPLADGRLLAAGRLSSSGGTPVRTAAIRDGGAWQSLGSGFDAQVTRLRTARDGRVYAVGQFTQAGSVRAAGAARWDGASWQAPADDPLLSGAAVEAPDGTLYRRFGAGVERLVGGVWERFGTFATGSTALMPQVNSPAIAPDGTVYVAGFFSSVDGVSVRNVARWNGTAWTPLGSGVGGGRYPNGTGSPVSQIVFGADGTVYAAGKLTEAGGQPAIGLAQWDGTAWSSLGGSFRDQPLDRHFYEWVYDLLATPDGSLYAAGLFGRVGDIEARGIARWDGAAWHALGAGLGDGSPAALALAPGGDLYAGGYFRSAGGAPARGLARWDGAAWTAVGDPDGSVWALAFDSAGDLIVGGSFITIGGVFSPYVSRYTTRPVAQPAAPTEARTLTIGPNPARTHATAFVSTEAPAALDVFDALGRRVARLDVARGASLVPLPVERLPPGVYVVRLTSGAEAQSARLVVVR